MSDSHSESSLLEEIEQTRLEIRRLRHEAARRVDEIEWRGRQIDEEFAALETSPLREQMVRLRHRAAAPWAMAGNLLTPVQIAREWLATTTGYRRVQPAVQHVFGRSIPLRGTRFSASETDQPSLTDAVRWVEPVTLRGVQHHALVMHPTSSATFDVTLEPGARFIVQCGIVPEVMSRSRDGVLFEVTVSSSLKGPGSWSERRTLLVQPRTRWIDRGWRTIVVPLPREASGPASVTLATHLAPQGSAEFAWAIWGEPQLAWQRSAGEIVRLTKAVTARDGWRGAARRLRDVGTVDAATEYRRWLAANAPAADHKESAAARVNALARRPLISVIVPTYNSEVHWLHACVGSILAQSYPDWELCIVDDASTKKETVEALEVIARKDPRIKYLRLTKNGHISAASNAALDMATGEFIALLDHDDELSSDALLEIASCANEHPDVDFIYSDEDKLDQAGLRCEPYFKPDWSPEHFLNFMYTNHLMVLRRDLVERAGRFRVGFEGSQDYDLALRVISESNRVQHVPKVLYHWRKVPGSAASEPVAKPWALTAARRALEAHVERNNLQADVLDGDLQGLFRVKPRIRGNPLVTILMPTDDRTRDIDGRLLALVPNAVRSIVQKTAYKNYELLIVDNGRISDETKSFLSGVPHRRMSYTIEGSFNFAHKLNFCAKHAKGEQLLIFNDDLEVINSDWLTALLEYSQQPEIGAVGAKLRFPDGRLQHIGMVLGVCGVAAHAFHCAPASSGGYYSSARGARNYSAVTGACLMTRRAVFEQVGGFNERLAIDFNDVDYCLRVRSAGYRVVYTPYAELYHYESGTLGPRTQNKSEFDLTLETWKSVVAADPYYNPNLTRNFPDYRLA